MISSKNKFSIIEFHLYVILFIFFIAMSFYQLFGVSASKNFLFIGAISLSLIAVCLGCDERFNHRDVSKILIRGLAKQKLLIWFSKKDNAAKAAIFIGVPVLLIIIVLRVYCDLYCDESNRTVIEGYGISLTTFNVIFGLFIFFSTLLFGVGCLVCKFHADETKKTAQDIQLGMYAYACLMFIAERIL